MSEIAFCVLPWPSAESLELTLGHFSASSRADAVVTRRQLLPPNPSVKPSLIFFGPHHDGTAEVFASGFAAATKATLHASASAMSAPLLFVLIVPISLLLADSLKVLRKYEIAMRARRSLDDGREAVGRARSS